MRLTLRGTLAEITLLRDELVIVHLVASGGVRVLHLADAKITTHPYSDHTRLDADLVEDGEHA
ncbi:hypothetical protein Aple_065890 [Acrocarpospora pleiomorpha]|uniref:Uncharacterized protein n=1 Tax=Acrocarpospora pleiomorpha TaxID=90975 RepID=A0A5M3XSC0_9ACTN|nr:hypothetical protein [Acrocarpospora pleiomorpha]GES23690.1 hypothetical protein Aple_065890 [Acrocarpospora pleiomorpha]